MKENPSIDWPTVRYWLAMRAEQHGECLLWLYATDRDGYPQTKEGDITLRPHRIICLLYKGSPPSQDHRALHTCDMPSCINPDHLYWGSAQQNANDAVQRKRLVNIKRRPVMRLTLDEYKYIQSDIRPLQLIADEYGCSYKTIQKIRRGERGP